MTAPRCDLTELPVDGCAHCRGHTDPPPVADTDLWCTLVARWPGTCARCGEPFDAGVTIGRLVDGGGYIGPECLP